MEGMSGDPISPPLRYTPPLHFLLQPSHSRIFPLQRCLELRITGCLKCRPVGCRFKSFAVRRAQPEFHRQFPFANFGVLLQRETFVELHLQFWWIRFALLLPRAFRVEQFES